MSAELNKRINMRNAERLIDELIQESVRLGRNEADAEIAYARGVARAAIAKDKP